MLLLLCFLVPLFLGPVFGQSTYGREFYVGFADHFGHESDINLQLDIAAKSNGTINITDVYEQTKTTYIYTRTKAFSVNFSRNRILFSSGESNFTGLYIASTMDIAVYLTSYDRWMESADTYAALPLPMLGNRYSVASYTPVISSSIFIVISSSNNTKINITLPDGTFKTETLNAMEVYQEKSDLDLTGTLIEANKPVAAVSGLMFSYISKLGNSGGNDHYMTQLVPAHVETSSHVIVPYIYPRCEFIIRIIKSSAKQPVDICLHYNSSSDCSSLKRNGWMESPILNKTIVVTSTDTFSVMQYKGLSGFLSYIPGVNQYLSEYVFVIPTIYTYAQNNYLAIIIPVDEQRGLLLDDSQIPALVSSENVPRPLDNYIVLALRIWPGFHHIRHTRNVKFGVFCYGNNYTGTYPPFASYGFPAGFAIGVDECQSNPCLNGATCIRGVAGYTCSCLVGYSGNNCEHDVNECESNPCLNGATCGDGVSAYTCTCRPGFHGVHCEHMMRRRMCFACDDMSHPGLCDRVQECANGQQCMVQRSHGKYRSGCANSKLCSTPPNVSSESNCVQCCGADYCNSHGCGMQELIPREDRGPFCFDCNHVLSGQECDSVKPCFKDQICGIESFDWAGLFHFKLGCFDVLCGTLAESPAFAVDMKRSTPFCKSCCTEDFCNRNCTRHSPNHGVIIG
ncbi:uncharacterized protein LOC128220615 [Mya arenaria]|uniref:uncharacterized protein LOC128220615 n=1 Tax=Mya arenaria TaxID=6604 RepID=UPI0022E2FD32|nr:uncharacterized protein LOC128220615 [Mya arenaria]